MFLYFGARCVDFEFFGCICIEYVVFDFEFSGFVFDFEFFGFVFNFEFFFNLNFEFSGEKKPHNFFFLN